MIFVILCTINVYSQKDTIVIIVDKNADYLIFHEDIPILKADFEYDAKYINQKFFVFEMKSHYFDGTRKAHLAKLNISEIKEGYRDWKIDKYQIKILKTELSRFKLTTTDAINKASSVGEIDSLVYFDPYERKIQFVVFKDSLDNEEIILYRVVAFRFFVIE